MFERLADARTFALLLDASGIDFGEIAPQDVVGRVAVGYALGHGRQTTFGSSPACSA